MVQIGLGKQQHDDEVNVTADREPGTSFVETAPFKTASAGAETPAMGEGCELPLRFEINSLVQCEDRTCGKLHRVVIDPATENVTHLIVKRRRPGRQAVVVPVSTVKEASAEQVHLKTSSADLNSYKPYQELDFRVPVVGWRSDRYKSGHVVYAMSPYEGMGGQSLTPSKNYRFHEGIPFRLKAVGKGTPVHNTQGPLGEIDHVLVDCAQGHITHLVVHDREHRDYRIVPVEMVAAVDDAALTLTGTHDDLTGLPRYQR